MPGDPMRAWMVKSFADSPPLRLTEAPKPTARADHLLVRVLAVGINYADSLAIRGQYQVQLEPPFIAGSELCGEVVEAPARCGFKAGQRIVAQVQGGAAAQYCLVPLHRVRPAPAALDTPSAAAISVTYPTAHLALFNGRRVAPPDVALIHAAAGGVGTAAVQLAKRAGAIVIATAGSEEKLEVARRQGAHHALNYRDDAWPEQVRAILDGYGKSGVDVVVDPVGGEVAKHSLRLLAWRARYAVIGFASGQIPQIPANRLLLKAAQLAGVWWSPDIDIELLRSVHKDLDDGFADGSLRPVLGATQAFENYDAAIASVADGKSIGKTVVKVELPT